MVYEYREKLVLAETRGEKDAGSLLREFWTRPASLDRAVFIAENISRTRPSYSSAIAAWARRADALRACKAAAVSSEARRLR